MHATIEDWARFALDQMRGARAESGTLLPSIAYQRLHRAQPTGPGADDYALGWLVVQRPWARGQEPRAVGRCLHHAGSNNSWYALIWIAPERNLAILCTTNMGGEGVFPKIDQIIATVISDHAAHGKP